MSTAVLPSPLREKLAAAARHVRRLRALRGVSLVLMALVLCRHAARRVLTRLAAGRPVRDDRG